MPNDDVWSLRLHTSSQNTIDFFTEVVGMEKYHKPLSGFPEEIKESLPKAMSTVSGDLEGCVLSGSKCQVVFWEVKKAFEVDVHAHPHAEWGIVVCGSCELTIGNETRTYFAGQEFYIPPEAPHKSQMSDNYRAVDFFNAPGWIKTKAE